MDMTIRPRRLRKSETLRKMVRETRMDKSSLIYPLFVKEGENIEEEIPSMEGQYRYSIDRLPYELERLQKAGVDKVMFFGIPDVKDEVGSQAYDDNGIVQRALRYAKEHFPQIKEKIWRMEQEHNDTIIIPIKNKQQRMLHKESIRYMERKGRKTYIHVVDDDIVETYKLVTTVRSNSLKNLISRESPLGAAIFGHKVGDRCEVKVNDSYSYFVEIRRIENTVDDGSDELRKF